ncbi:MAG: ribonuclease H-like domain-containing protein [Caldicoprobacterales bacterium]|jgi:uncharacterized protein YprB with RNaseH-like and TPR domain|nr:hypothetical protein [Clostridiales bacterium]
MIPNLKSKLKTMSSSSPLDKRNPGIQSDTIQYPDNPSMDNDFPDKESLDCSEYLVVNRKSADSDSGTDLKDSLCIKKSNFSMGNRENRDRTLVNDSDTRGNLDGEVIESPHGSFVRKRTFYGGSTAYGSIAFSELLAADFSDSKFWSRLNRDICLRDLVFLDTETTGLSGGTGTYAFLVGLGYITDEGLVVEQYLMRDFDEEYPMLQSLLDTLKRFKILVSFNGKSFDWPLLESRLVYSRLRNIIWEDAHLDLLHVARRLWGYRLSSCSLISIEEEILGLQRSDDIPGHMIPKMYFDYLETRNTDVMQLIMQHNEWDIVSMAALLLYINRLYKDPEGKADACELLGIAKELERNYRIQEAANCYRRCIQTAHKHSLSVEAKKRLAYLTKRHHSPGEAMHLWADLSSEGDSCLIFPLIEMAKYYEHGKKEFHLALQCTERAIHLAGMRSTSSSRLKEELLVRRRRLINKMKRSM